MHTWFRVLCFSLVSALAAVAFVTQSYAQVLSLNFSSNTGGSIEFGGTNNDFSFNTGTNGHQWTVTSETGGSSAFGLQGSVLNGPFSYGPITLSNGGNTQSANVLGPLGQLVISDGALNLTGQVNWISVTTFFQSAGVFNDMLMINVTGIAYSGSNPDLQYLTAHQPGTMDLTFQFSPGMNLTMLSSGAGGYETSYSGSLSVPEPTTLALSGLGGLGLLWLRRRKS